MDKWSQDSGWKKKRKKGGSSWYALKYSYFISILEGAILYMNSVVDQSTTTNCLILIWWIENIEVFFPYRRLVHMEMVSQNKLININEEGIAL